MLISLRVAMTELLIMSVLEVCKGKFQTEVSIDVLPMFTLKGRAL